ncbi:hypothetical protein DR64_5278 [Paraburkholderia xenovorans LB400]|uniref:Cell wall surface anchor family protein n=1 Tax=Paraburkholderia xenovorans (strain LB400) TaxID=266265 RepID=Q13S91_PARXL|nr:hypothetical protein [Paraburkholderia xenovorans]ABE33048.1 hypothetical protein Bxe_B2947 [Paraburkholderia xenovorans LB400]AIP36580.1 hypothetical protein DR64_5278 [Paraburkholderia xenovorans LB400]
MADSVASTQSRPSRAASKKRRQATVSTETENKLARAARSAQRLAQLSDASRDDATLDLFPDDPTRATLEAMNIDIRQGTLHGFELPDVVLAAVGAIDTGDSASLEARAARRAPRTPKSDEPVPVNAQLSGLEIESVAAMAAMVSPVGELALGDTKPATDANAEEKPAVSAPLTPAMAAATVARSVTALRQASEPGAATGVTTDTPVASTSGVGKAPQRFAATFAKAASASASASALRGTHTAETTSAVDEPAPAESDAAPTESKAGTETLAHPSAPAQASTEFATPWREARRAEAAAAALRAAPELDRARATAFADTVDALYGVIADQRRAATDHSRRMKWMLSIVVGALLVTVAIGITQTVLLIRLTRETTAQQHRIEQMMQNQQAAMTSLLDTHLAMAMAMANAVAVNAAPAAATAAPATPQQATATAAHTRRTVRAQHSHRPKAASPH